MNKSQSVVTMTMTLLAFGSLIHSPEFNIPICHMLGTENADILHRQLTVCYEELNHLDGKMLHFDIPAPGIKYYATIKILHVYDLKYTYQAMGHVCWSSSKYPHIFCTCTSLSVHYTHEQSQPQKDIHAKQQQKVVVVTRKKKRKMNDITPGFCILCMIQQHIFLLLFINITYMHCNTFFFTSFTINSCISRMCTYD